METPRLNSGAPLPPNHARSATSRENSHVQPQQSHSDIDERIVTLQKAGHRFVRIDRIAKEPFQDTQTYLDEAPTTETTHYSDRSVTNNDLPRTDADYGQHPYD